MFCFLFEQKAKAFALKENEPEQPPSLGVGTRREYEQKTKEP